MSDTKVVSVSGSFVTKFHIQYPEISLLHTLAAPIIPAVTIYIYCIVDWPTSPNQADFTCKRWDYGIGHRAVGEGHRGGQ